MFNPGGEREAKQSLKRIKKVKILISLFFQEKKEKVEKTKD